MGKRKIESTISIADGVGGMAAVADLRFEPTEWPIRFEVSAGSADCWMARLNAECSERERHLSFRFPPSNARRTVAGRLPRLTRNGWNAFKFRVLTPSRLAISQADSGLGSGRKWLAINGT